MNNKFGNIQCTGCGACSAICPKKCIQMSCDNLGFIYPSINHEECINCGLCEEVCSICYSNNDTLPLEESYAAFNKDELVRRNSSSGGLFSALANYVLDNGGIVVGASFDETYENVCHIVIEHKDELYKIQGSKYIQSNTTSIYAVVKEYLVQNKEVLFSGTPCQIFALKKYLRQDFDNLYLVEIACHGVPSPFVWKEYVSYLSKKKNGKIEDVQFRYKNPSWEQYEVKITFTNGKVYQKMAFEDLYMRGFIQNMYLRPSCYTCKHKGNNSVADITLADFWGITKVFPELNDDKGVSLVIVRTNKGNKLFNLIRKNLYIRKTEFELAVQDNPAITSSSKINARSRDFLVGLNEDDVYKILKKYCDKSFAAKIRSKVKKILK